MQDDRGRFDVSQRRFIAGFAGGAVSPNACYAEKLLPQPQPPVEFGFLKVKPEPCMEVT